MQSDKANPLRGEVEIMLAGKPRVMRPTFAAIMEIEAALGGVVPLARRAAKGEFGLRDLAVVIHAGLKGAGGEDTLDEVGEAVLAAGVAHVTAPVRDFLTNVLSGLADE